MQTKEMMEAFTEGFCLTFPILSNVKHLEKCLTNSHVILSFFLLMIPSERLNLKSNCPILSPSDYWSWDLFLASVFKLKETFRKLPVWASPSEIFNKILLFLFLLVSFFSYNNGLAGAKWVSQELFHIDKQASPGKAATCPWFPRHSLSFHSSNPRSTCFPRQTGASKISVSAAWRISKSHLGWDILQRK